MHPFQVSCCTTAPVSFSSTRTGTNTCTTLNGSFHFLFHYPYVSLIVSIFLSIIPITCSSNNRPQTIWGEGRVKQVDVVAIGAVMSACEEAQRWETALRVILGVSQHDE